MKQHQDQTDAQAMIRLDPTQQLQIDELEPIICKVLRHVFYACYERAFGQPTAEICAKIDQADAQALAEWLPNFVNASKDADLFVSGLEYSFAQFSSSLIARKFGIQTGPVCGLGDIVTSIAKAQGIEAGEASSKIGSPVDVLTSQFTQRFGPLSPDTAKRLQTATPEQLELWADRILDAPSLDAVFAQH